MVSSNTEQPSQPNLTIGHANKLSLESPPEAAIEATPETTPFVTPVKVGFFFHWLEIPLWFDEFLISQLVTSGSRTRA